MKDMGGFTLIEILVAAVIIIVSMIAIIVVIRKGIDIELNDLHRRQARIRICGNLDSRTYSNANYANLTAGSTTETDTLDLKPVVVGTLTKTITGPTSMANNNGISIDIITITMRMTWAENSYNDTLIINKWVCDVN